MKKHFRAEYVKCGKKGCGGCPHGPYWYEYWREDGKLKKKYRGKVPPWANDSSADQGIKARTVDVIEPDWREKMLKRETATMLLALEILGLSWPATHGEAKKAFREKALETHPDRGGSDREQMYVNAAWSFLRNMQGWK